MNLTEIILIFTIALILGLFWQINQLKENRAQEDQIVHLKENLQELRTRIDLLIDANRLSGVDLKNDLNRDLATLRTTLVEQLEASGRGVRETLTQRLAEIQLDTSNKLEQMRQTVDEKLHATLEQRLGESFKLVSDRLEQVHRGLGEMQTLATGVGDLKRVLTNVKSRGTWGEVQLGALIEQTLTIEQYSKNIATRPNSRDIVEFAIRLPGQEEGKPVWLPIDAKFPVEDYQRLTDAQDRADLQEIESAAKALETRIKAEAKTIREKYIEPPYTTDFAILFLPTEGLYAEVLRRQGLLELLQNDFRVTVAGPSTFSAMLNSLQMGFKTLSIEKRSSQIWSTLGQVKTEFSKFGEAIEATKKRLDAASKQFEAVDIRTRKINRALSNVEAVSSNSSTLLAIDLDDPDEDSKPEGSST
ncbi:MAG: DNA recombination protein RmuC [Betaproteobacteria bacterium]|jgi:DNA recombination protein RmuC|nr:DNA recombination protein RmuC [Polynucleobacter sp.]NBY64292.1 DNA recombination protein RmuC [Betaproteobacteria bacterium]